MRQRSSTPKTRRDNRLSYIDNEIKVTENAIFGSRLIKTLSRLMKQIFRLIKTLSRLMKNIQINLKLYTGARCRTVGGGQAALNSGTKVDFTKKLNLIQMF